jgi:hypothetical protein
VGPGNPIKGGPRPSGRAFGCSSCFWSRSEGDLAPKPDQKFHLHPEYPRAPRRSTGTQKIHGHPHPAAPGLSSWTSDRLTAPRPSPPPSPAAAVIPQRRRSAIGGRQAGARPADRGRRRAGRRPGRWDALVPQHDLAELSPGLEALQRRGVVLQVVNAVDDHRQTAGDERR